MTARETCRTAAERMDNMAASEGSEWRRLATALRRLAYRLDAEMANARKYCPAHCDLILARLDSPLDVDPNSTHPNHLSTALPKGDPG